MGSCLVCGKYSSWAKDNIQHLWGLMSPMDYLQTLDIGATKPLGSVELRLCYAYRKKCVRTVMFWLEAVNQSHVERRSCWFYVCGAKHRITVFRRALRPAQLGYGLSRHTPSDPSATPSVRPSRRLTYVLLVELKRS